mmetsp:Transcript_40844/g.132299  ORF Transcript_40844/g.132299 Transcript_40844/m.132299 type:complete len:232 (-) Transcript_40844:421-1116(-)
MVTRIPAAGLRRRRRRGRAARAARVCVGAARARRGRATRRRVALRARPRRPPAWRVRGARARAAAARQSAVGPALVRAARAGGHIARGAAFGRAAARAHLRARHSGQPRCDHRGVQAFGESPRGGAAHRARRRALRGGARVRRPPQPAAALDRVRAAARLRARPLARRAVLGLQLHRLAPAAARARRKGGVLRRRAGGRLRDGVREPAPPHGLQLLLGGRPLPDRLCRPLL